MGSEWCAACRRFHFGDAHLPAWECVICEADGTELDWYTIHSHSLSGAAERAAEEYGDSDAPNPVLVDGSVCVMARRPGLGWTRYIVDAEATVVYTARGVRCG